MPVKVGLRYIEIWKDDLEPVVCRYEQEQQAAGQIVFYGPSYFTRWSEQYGMIPMREVLRGASGAPCVVNRGFGSSCSEHQLYYYPRMIRPLAPKVLVYSSVGNGLAFGYTLEEIWELAQRVIAYARVDFPDIRICLCGSQYHRKDTPADEEQYRLYDSWLKEFAERTPNCRYINVMDYEPLREDSIFVDDGVHFNQEGYHRYAEFFREALKEELARF